MNSSEAIHIEGRQDFPDAVFGVEVISKDGSRSMHSVSLSEQYYQDISDGITTPEALVKQSFRFLLERESKESIMVEFELPVIEKYFPEYETVIQKMLSHS